MEKRFLHAASLIARQPPLPGSAGLTDHLRRLCVAAAPAMSAVGVGVNVMVESAVRGLYAASDPEAEQLEELQSTLGEGPCIEAFSRRRPVLVPDLNDLAAARWPAYVEAVRTLGIRAVFAFPLQVGAAQVGVLDVFRDYAGMLAEAELRLALTFAEIATATVLDRANPTDDVDRLGQELLGSRAEVYQAQGMLTSQLGISLADAMARMRAYAYAHDLRLTEVAASIISGRLRLEAQKP